MNELEIKSIIGHFIKKDPEEINNSTEIGNLGSVLLPRMYAELKKKNYLVSNTNNINTYGDLITSLTNGDKVIQSPTINHYDHEGKSESNLSSIGIDLESLNSFPVVPDYRKDEFYKSVFSEKEISYCVIKKNPQESFAGKFAAKEALIKVDNSLASLPLNQIEIINDEDGKPFFNGFNLSISHSNGFAVGVALKKNINFKTAPKEKTQNLNEYVKKTDIDKIYRNIKKMKFVIILITALIVVFECLHHLI